MTTTTPNLTTSNYASAERSPREVILSQYQLWANAPQLQAMMNAFPQGTVIVNNNRQIVFGNQVFTQMIAAADVHEYLGLRVGEAVQCIHANEMPGGCGTTLFCQKCGAVNAILSSLKGNEAVEECLINRGDCGPRLELRVWTTPIQLMDEAFTIFVIQDIALEKQNTQLMQQVQQLAITDALTGIANRRHFFEQSEREIARAIRFEKPLSLAIFDLNRFKQVNDHYGHLVGDEVLLKAAALMKTQTRAIDVLARYGGDEFILLMVETDLHEAKKAVSRILDCLKTASIHTEKINLRISASAGIAEYDPHKHPTLEALIEEADQALYSSKREYHAPSQTIEQVACH